LPPDRLAAVVGLLGRLKVMGLTAETAQAVLTPVGVVVVASLAQGQITAPPPPALLAACPFGTRLAVLARPKITPELAPPPPVAAVADRVTAIRLLTTAVLAAREMNTGP
jgi:hypothetical protein